MSSRFVSKLLRHLLAGMEAKDKNVRFRVTLMTASLINGLGEIEWVVPNGAANTQRRAVRDASRVPS